MSNNTEKGFKAVTVRIPLDLYKNLKKNLVDKDMSLQSYIIDFIKKDLEK